MGIFGAGVRFDSQVPSFSSIQRTLATRTGLTITVSERGHGASFSCDEFPAEVDVIVRGHVVALYMGLSESVYLLDEVQESLVELGGRRSNVKGTTVEDDAPPREAVLWRDRSWTERSLDRHPGLVSLLILVLQLPRELLRRLFG